MFRTDNRTIFNFQHINPDKRTSEKDTLTQFGYACKQLGTSIETTSVSQAKGLIERDNGTFQGRLINELKLNGIYTIEEANEYLITVFIPKFNKNFSLNYKKFQSVFEESPTEEVINYTLSILTPRKIDNGNAIKFHNDYYLPYEDGTIKCFLPKTECLVIQAYNKQLLVSVCGKVYELRKLEKHKKYSKEFDIIPEEIIENNEVYIPQMKYSWDVENFKEQIEKAHTKKVYA